MSKAVSLGLIYAALFSTALSAQEQRWFEIELLVFSQTPAAELQESFADTVTPIKPGRAYDLLTPRYQTDLTGLLAALPLCNSAPTLATEFRFNLNLPKQLCLFEPQLPSWQQSSVFESRYINSKLPYPAHIGPLITGSGEYQTQPYLAEQSALQLTELANKIKRQAGVNLLLHTSWRQAPVTERRAIASRWFAGKNFSQQFDYWGQPKTHAQSSNNTALLNELNKAEQLRINTSAQSSNELIANIEQLLQQLNANNQLPERPVSALEQPSSTDSLAARNLPDQVWQLDGLFKLHLDHYLFVNTEFNLRLPTKTGLQTVHVRQNRRVISGEIHYLDHPYLGIVLQIRRYEPAITTEELTAQP